MRNTILLFALLCFGLGTEAQVLNSATAIFLFDGEIHESLSGLMPTVTDNYSFTEDRHGNPEGAVSFPGTFNYGNPDFAQPGTSDFSIAFWFRKDGSLWQTKSIIRKLNLLTDNLFYEEYGAFYDDFFGSMQIRFKPSNTNNQVNLSPGAVPVGIWTHFAITFERDDQMRLYVNGQLFSSDYIGDLSGLSANIEGGDLIMGEGQMSLDDVVFFHHLLSPSEVIELAGGEANTVEEAKKPLASEMVIFPNPASDFVSIRLSSGRSELCQLTVIDSYGKICVSEEMQLIDGRMEIDVSNLSEGMYTLQTNIAGDFYRTQMVVTR